MPDFQNVQLLDTIAAPHQGSGPSDVLKANNSQGKLLGEGEDWWKECLDEAMWTTGQNFGLLRNVFRFHLGFFQKVFLLRSTLPHLLQALHVLQQQLFDPGRTSVETVRSP